MSDRETQTLTANTEQVLARIEAAAKRVGRERDDITLVAVTKTHPVETVIRAYQIGLRHYGENRTFEKEKISAFNDWLDIQGEDSPPPTWHFIGHLQTRQVGEVLGRYQMIHSVDSLKLAHRLNRLAERDEVEPLDILLQCNVSGEAAKSGFELSKWAEDRAQVDDFLTAVAEIEALEHVTIRGLMTMAPIVSDPEKVRPVFRSLATLRDHLQQEMPEVDWQHLSMGMTDDFEVAIEEGATIVRVGRAIFGERQALPKK